MSGMPLVYDADLKLDVGAPPLYTSHVALGKPEADGMELPLPPQLHAPKARLQISVVHLVPEFCERRCERGFRIGEPFPGIGVKTVLAQRTKSARHRFI